MLLAFGIVLFTIAVYMGLDAVTVRQKQVAGSLARARRYGGGTLRETELTKDVTNRLIAPTARKLADLATALPMTQNPDEIRRRLIAAGLDVVQVQAQLGHANPAITLRLYGGEFQVAQRRDALRDKIAGSGLGAVLRS